MSAVAENFLFKAVSRHGGTGFGKLDAVDSAESAVFLDLVGMLGFEGLGFFIELGFEVFSLGEEVILFDSLESGY